MKVHQFTIKGLSQVSDKKIRGELEKIEGSKPLMYEAKIDSHVFIAINTLPEVEVMAMVESALAGSCAHVIS